MRTLVPTTDQIVKQFQAGQSMADIATKHGMTHEQLEYALRRWLYVKGLSKK